MSAIYSTRTARIKENLDRIFGNSPQAEELKSIALKAQTEGITDEDARLFWEQKEKEIAELKERMPDVGDLALPFECKTFYGEEVNHISRGEEEMLAYSLREDSSNPFKCESQLIVNGTIDVSGQREDGGCKNPAIKHEVVIGHCSER